MFDPYIISMIMLLENKTKTCTGAGKQLVIRVSVVADENDDYDITFILLLLSLMIIMTIMVKNMTIMAYKVAWVKMNPNKRFAAVC